MKMCHISLIVRFTYFFHFLSSMMAGYVLKLMACHSLTAFFFLGGIKIMVCVTVDGILDLMNYGIMKRK